MKEVHDQQEDQGNKLICSNNTSCSDNKNQIIDLIKGPASFEIQYMGDSHFKATLMYADGRVVDVLADVDGQYKGKKKVDIPETTAYILDVQCKGQWSVYRE